MSSTVKKIKNEVAVISSLHQYHDGHATYDYEKLYFLINSFHPEFIGIEIREEDFSLSRGLLDKIYPFEMIEIKMDNPGKTFGFDWFERELEGKKTPENYFETSKIVQLLEELSFETKLDGHLKKELHELNENKIKMIKTSAPSSLYNGDYDALCEEVDNLQSKWLENTPYFELVLHKKRRNEKIIKNIVEFINKNNPKNIVVVVGADHRWAVMKGLLEMSKFELVKFQV